MMFVTIITIEGNIKTYGKAELDNLIDLSTAEMPIGVFTYRIVSKNMILRIEFSSMNPYVLTYTNVEKRRHGYIIKKILDKVDEDYANMEIEASDTEIEDLT